MKTPKRHRNFSNHGRKRVTVWLEDGLVEKIRFEAKQGYITQQRIIESAIRDAYKPPAEGLQEFIARRCNYLDGRIQKIDVQSQITAEALSLFFRLWMHINPRVREAGKYTPDEQEFYGKCVKTIALKLEEGGALFRDVRDVKR